MVSARMQHYKLLYVYAMWPLIFVNYRCLKKFLREVYAKKNDERSELFSILHDLDFFYLCKSHMIVELLKYR